MSNTFGVKVGIIAPPMQRVAIKICQITIYATGRSSLLLMVCLGGNNCLKLVFKQLRNLNYF